MISELVKVAEDPTSTALSREEMTKAHIDLLKHIILCSNKYMQEGISSEARGIWLNEVRVCAASLVMILFHAAGRESRELLEATQLCNKLLVTGIHLWADDSQKLREIEKMNSDKTTMRA